MQYLIDFGLLAVLIVLSALFSGSEIAMMALSPAKVRELEEKKIRGAKLLSSLKSNTHQLLIVILIGNNLVNIGASVYATVIFTKIFGSSGVGLATGIMTLLVLVFGEITPKTLAHRYRVKFALLMARPLILFKWIFYPIMISLDWLIKVMTSTEKEKQQYEKVSEGELKAMIELGVEEGTIERHERELLQNVLEFSDITVEDVMTPRVKIDALEASTTLKAAAKYIAQHTHSRIPVYRKSIDNIIGMISVKELLHYLETGKDLHKKLSEVTLKKPLNVPYSYKIYRLFKEVQKTNIHMAVIRDEYGGVMGLATLEDLLEEIVGEIVDEFDIDQKWILAQGKNWIRIQGGTPVEVITDHFHKEFPGDQHDPISSAILEKLHRFPESKEIIKFGKFKVKIEKMKENSIAEVRVEKAK